MMSENQALRKFSETIAAAASSSSRNIPQHHRLVNMVQQHSSSFQQQPVRVRYDKKDSSSSPSSNSSSSSSDSDSSSSGSSSTSTSARRRRRRRAVRRRRRASCKRDSGRMDVIIGSRQRTTPALQKGREVQIGSFFLVSLSNHSSSDNQGCHHDNDDDLSSLSGYDESGYDASERILDEVLKSEEQLVGPLPQPFSPY